MASMCALLFSCFVLTFLEARKEVATIVQTLVGLSSILPSVCHIKLAPPKTSVTMLEDLQKTFDAAFFNADHNLKLAASLLPRCNDQLKANYGEAFEATGSNLATMAFCFAQLLAKTILYSENYFVLKVKLVGWDLLGGNIHFLLDYHHRRTTQPCNWRTISSSRTRPSWTLFANSMWLNRLVVSITINNKKSNKGKRKTTNPLESARRR